MVKVTIEATGEETEVLTGEMVNAVILEEVGCKVMCVSNTKNRVGVDKFIKSLMYLVHQSIEAYSIDDVSCDLLHMLFAMEMRDDVKKYTSDRKMESMSKENTTDKSVEDTFKEFIEIFGKVVGE